MEETNIFKFLFENVDFQEFNPAVSDKEQDYKPTKKKSKKKKKLKKENKKLKKENKKLKKLWKSADKKDKKKSHGKKSNKKKDMENLIHDYIGKKAAKRMLSDMSKRMLYPYLNNDRLPHPSSMRDAIIDTTFAKKQGGGK